MSDDSGASSSGPPFSLKMLTRNVWEGGVEWEGRHENTRLILGGTLFFGGRSFRGRFFKTVFQEGERILKIRLNFSLHLKIELVNYNNY